MIESQQKDPGARVVLQQALLVLVIMMQNAVPTVAVPTFCSFQHKHLALRDFFNVSNEDMHKIRSHTKEKMPERLATCSRRSLQTESAAVFLNDSTSPPQEPFISQSPALHPPSHIGMHCLRLRAYLTTASLPTTLLGNI